MQVGIYVPFFLPAMVPLLQGLLKEGRRYWRRHVALHAVRNIANLQKTMMFASSIT